MLVAEARDVEFCVVLLDAFALCDRPRQLLLDNNQLQRLPERFGDLWNLGSLGVAWTPPLCSSSHQ